MSEERQGNGKIARLPVHIREELNERLLNGEPGPKIRAWLHTLPEVLRVLDEHFGEQPINDENLSNWRQGGFQSWLKRREKIAETRALADHCMRIAEAGGGAMHLPAAIAGGQLMQVLEDFDPDVLKATLAEKPETWLGVLEMLAKLQKSQADSRVAATAEKKLEHAQVKLQQAERALALAEQKFQRETAALFLKFYADQKAKEIAESKTAKETKMADLVQLFFGERPSNLEGPAQ